MEQTPEQLSCPLWTRAYKSPVIQSIVNFCNHYELEYVGIDRRQEEPDQFWFQWTGEIPGTWVKVEFQGRNSDKPSLMLINGILNGSRMRVLIELELQEEDFEHDQIEAALDEASLIIGFG